MTSAVDLAEKFAGFSDHWRPRIAAQLNGQDLRIVKVQGVFPWHSHLEADELFLVWSGDLTIKLRDEDVRLGPGDIFVVPRGVVFFTVMIHLTSRTGMYEIV